MFGQVGSHVMSAGAHTHSVSGTTVSNGAHIHATSENPVGNNEAHNNLQPYITVYMFKRTV